MTASFGLSLWADIVVSMAFRLILLLGLITGPALAAGRQFRMGFTPFPYDQTEEAVKETYRFLAGNADVVVHHMESVPWIEALRGQAFSSALDDNWKTRKGGTPKGAKVVLVLSPGRGTLAQYWGARENMPIPAGFNGKRFYDPMVMSAYLEYCRRAVEFFKPDYLGIGVEVNEIYLVSPRVWTWYAELHRYIYAEMKKRYPDLPIFASFTLHAMLDRAKPPRDRARMLNAYREIMPYNDIVPISFYPFIGGLSGEAERSLKWAVDQFGAERKPFAVVETGEPADTVAVPRTKLTVRGTPEGQAAYYETLLSFASRHRFAFVTSFLYRDYDALWLKIRDKSPGFFIAWRDCGLLDEGGNKRPAYSVWRRYFENSLISPSTGRVKK